MKLEALREFIRAEIKKSPGSRDDLAIDIATALHPVIEAEREPVALQELRAKLAGIALSMDMAASAEPVGVLRATIRSTLEGLPEAERLDVATELGVVASLLKVDNERMSALLEKAGVRA